MHPMVQQLTHAMQQAADPTKAGPMQAYMKTAQPFYGVQAGPRQKLFKTIARQFKQISREAYGQIIDELWRGHYREDQYQAIEVAQYYKTYHTKESWPIYEGMIRTATNWDTLDGLASWLIGPLILRHRELENELVKWSVDDNMWVRRASLLAHLHHKQQTNTHLLSELILRLAHEQEFFIRKAIGWVLRDYSYTDPAWVESFVTQHSDKLSGLSKREALKVINKRS